jgi:hypothetical protein
MSADFEKVLVKDARLDVADSIKYAVIKGGQNVTMAQYKAISQTNNQIVFNIQVPSEQTIIDRRILLQTDLTLSVITRQGASPNADSVSGCYYGTFAALASFPLHQLMTVLSATINNNTVSINIRDVLPAMIRLLDSDDLVYFNSSSPTFADTAVSYSPDYSGGIIPHPNNSYWAVNEACCIHRGSIAPFKYVQTFTGEDDIFSKEVFTWRLTEPLLLSPFFFANLKANNQGFYGIQNMNIVINIGDTKRVFRGMNSAGSVLPTYENPSPARYGQDAYNYITEVYAGKENPGGLYFENTQLLMNFLTPHPSDMLPARNIVPFYELPRYITPASASPLAALTIDGLSVSEPGSFTIRTQSLQLNQIPDKLIVYVRKNAAIQSWGDADVCFPITNVVVNFNNNSGILASATPVDLWQMSRNNGLKENWHEFNGLAVGAAAGGFPSGLAKSQVFSTVGSYLVLEFGKDIQLTEDFYAAGSLGNFNLQLNITIANNRPYALTTGAESSTNNVEAVLITMNSGVFVCERGTSSTYTGILTKQDVLEASQQDHYTHDDVERLVGGGFFDKIKSGFSKLASKGMEYGKKQLAKHGTRLMDKGANYLMKKGKKALAKYTKPASEEEDDE